MVLTLDDRRFVVEADFDDMRVTVDGTPVELGTPPVRAEGQFLVHGRPVLTALCGGGGAPPISNSTLRRRAAPWCG